jgi:hypothetical protein
MNYIEIIENIYRDGYTPCQETFESLLMLDEAIEWETERNIDEAIHYESFTR